LTGAVPRLRVLIASLAFAAALPASAHAGTYTVDACRSATGTAAPVAAWGFKTNYPKGGATSSCATGGWFGFGAPASAPTIPRGDAGWWTFTAPAGTRISAVSVWRYARTAIDKKAAYAWWNGIFHDTVNAADAIAHCSSQAGNCGANGVGNQSQPLAAANLVSVKNVSYGSLTAWAGCWPQGTTAACSTSYPYLDGLKVFRADVTLTDNTPPVFTALPAGDLVNPSLPLVGPRSVSFAAHDTGGGVDQASLEVDGHVMQTVDVGGCAPPFVKAVPCKPDATGTLTLDTASLADGSHLVRVLVDDATGTNTTAYGPVRVTTRNGTASCAPAAAGQPKVSAVFENGHGHRLRVSYGHRARVRGRVTAGGHVLAGVAVLPMARQETSGAPLVGHKPVVTDGRGIFGYTVPRGGSRGLRFGLRLHPTDTVVVCSPRLHLVVPAPSRVRARPRVSRNGRRVLFTGKVLGGHIPSQGKLVVLQGLDRHRWATIATFRTRRTGSFSYAYRFRHVARTTRFALRLQVRSEAGYPFAAGTSRAVHVTVLP
jgi:hypothetical protein